MRPRKLMSFRVSVLGLVSRRSAKLGRAWPALVKPAVEPFVTDQTGDQCA